MIADRQRGKGEDEVAGLHDRVLDESFRKRRDQAERDAEHQADADRHDADQNRDSRTGKQLRGDVATETVRSRTNAPSTAARACAGCRSRPAGMASRRKRSPPRRAGWRPTTRPAGGRRPRRIAALMRQDSSIRGSMAAQATSTTKFNPITMIAVSITQFSTTRVSRLEIDCSIRRPKSGQNEDVLHHDRARYEIGELQAHDGQDRNQRIGQGVPPKRRAPRHAFGAGGAHEIFVQRLQQGRAGDPSQDRRLNDAKGDGGKYERAARPPSAVPSPGSRPQEQGEAGRRRRSPAESPARSSARRGRSGSPP